VPDGWKVAEAETGGKKLAVDEKGTVDLTGLNGKLSLNFQVKRS
jgi:hypothetical protein